MPGARRTRKGMVSGKGSSKSVGKQSGGDREGANGVQKNTGAEQRGRGSYRVDGTPVDYAGPSVVIKSE